MELQTSSASIEKKIIKKKRREKEGSKKAVNIPTVFRNPRHIIVLCVVCAPVEYFISLTFLCFSNTFLSFFFPV